ncbi:hypothetical protein HY469_04475 [Candidatus Roizmanbacteria bacterium]|nr:hypothetical protein [Candidatus Roizmanbacteria bacterium]
MTFPRFSRRTVLIVGGISIVTISIGVYVWLEKNDQEAALQIETFTETAENIASDSAEPEEASPSAVASNEHQIKRAFSGGGATSCVLTTSDATARLYIKKEMFRMTEITPNGAPEPLKDEILTLNATVWIWNSVNKTGYMMSDLTGIYSSSTVLKKLYEASDEELKEGFTNAGLTLTDCTSQNIDQTVFDLPSDVEFKPITDTIRDQILSP